MSEQEEIKLFERIRESIASAQRKMVERKAKLNETVIIADNNGMPLEVSAEEALNLYSTRVQAHNELPR
ncbi:MAG: hypothetical protein NC043_00900 [Muribaculaceae bacterium]|nr:hypothetical protein [Muribaculaceae bacterium]